MEDFISFELAKKLKEKGFREKCLAYYAINDDELWLNSSDFQGETYKELLCAHEDDCIDAPTLSQVLKWLREKYIHIEVSIYYNSTDDADGYVQDEWYYWGFRVMSVNSGRYIDTKRYNVEEEFDSYEAAALAGIGYVLDNLI